MKKSLTLALALVALAVFTGLGVAQQKGEEKKLAAAPVMEQQARPQQIIGEVTRVDPKTNTFTVKGKDVDFTLSKEGPTTRVKVDCGKGESINKALRHNAEELVIEISGICQEDVVVRRDKVTLRGANPSSDGIAAVGGDQLFGAGLLILFSADVRLENLKLTGGPFYALRVQDSPAVTVTNCRFEAAGSYGARVSRSTAILEDSSFTGNGEGGLLVTEAGRINCKRCTLKDNPSAGLGTAFTADQNAFGTLSNSEFGGQIGPQAHQQSQVYVFDSTVNATETGSGRQSILDLIRVQVTGSLSAFFHSQVNFTSSTQLANPGQNSFNTESTLRVRGSTIAGNTAFFAFSNGIISSDSAVNGTLNCFQGGNAFCNNPAVVSGTSNCALCPKP